MRFVLPLAALALVAQTAQAQAPTTSLTLDEAIALARRNNPLFQQTVNARRSADIQVRSAYASLLPSVSANLAGRYQQTGQQFVSGIALSNNSDVLQSSYGLNVNYQVNSAVLFAPKLYAANRNAALGWPQARHAVEGGRNAHRSARVRSEPEGAETGGDGSAGAAARPA